MLAPEVYKEHGNFDDWKTLVGTGAYMIGNYVPDSSWTYKKNPDYWGRVPKFPQNKLPYADTFKILIIPDRAAQMAALRSGRIDLMRGISFTEGQQTHHAHNLLEKTRAVDALAMDPRRTDIIRTILRPDVQISSVVASRPAPGDQPQLLHQDNGHFPIPCPHMPLVATTLTALDPFMEENGATRVVPGSLRSTGSVDQNAETVVVEMDAGSMYVMHGALWHADGGNTSEDRFRRSIIINYNLALLKQCENQFIGVPPEIAVEMPEEMQRLIGYQVTNSKKFEILVAKALQYRLSLP